MKGLKAFATKVALSYALMIPLVWLRAVVLLKFVEWFVAPVVRVPPIPVTAAMGFLLIPLLWQLEREGTERPADGIGATAAVVQNLLNTLGLWVAGALVSFVGRAAVFVGLP